MKIFKKCTKCLLQIINEYQKSEDTFSFSFPDRVAVEFFLGGASSLGEK